jgi:chromosome partitioning protein
MPAKIVVVFNQKGGCGKTTSTLQLGGTLGRAGKRVLIVDMDSQGTGIRHYAMASPENPFPADVRLMAPLQEMVISEVRKNLEKYDLIFIDCPPAIESSIPWAALNIADIAIIPVIPVMDNIWASVKAKELAMRAKKENPSLQTFFLATMVRRGRIFKLCMKQLKADTDVPMLSASISLLNAFPESQVIGGIVQDLDANSKASLEMNAVASELLGLLEMRKAA